MSHPRASRSQLAAVVTLVAALAVAAEARAYEEETTLELGPVLVVSSGGEPVAFGAGAEALVGFGLSQAWSIGASLRYVGYPHATSVHRIVPALEATWQLDLLRWVPRIGLGIGSGIGFGPRARADLDAYLRLGIDRLVGSGFVGIDLRTDVLCLGTIDGAGRVDTSLVLRWGFRLERF